ncbi:uncharacterized protein LOC108739157 [Agrilus planipennis]|uniref:Spliceosome-associated protein CWC27 homolog n=1 Tax=Agrilus planipennis TaxID=224129 RepID=A0A1W4X6F8_AGRPL|nr:uncharacterized protein LOC108739157 [Agrilus planipennis]
MSNIYILEPPTSGKVLLKTTVGDIDVELWAKETPKACRNFIQLCMEGYYDGTIFHRVVKGFIVQGGDPSGDGTGGESIYGEPFKDEFHQRLRFTRRGLLAMANAGKDDNGSQFFFTLGPAAELQNKHTLFGKVTGETLFNMLKLEEGLIVGERPEYPHKIIKTEVLHNPFPDIVPRIKEVKEEKKKKKEKVPGVKNFKLLSFGEEAEEDEEENVKVNEKFAGKGKSTHDILDDPKLSSETIEKVQETERNEEETESDPLVQLEKIRKKLKRDIKNEDKLHSKQSDKKEEKPSIKRSYFEDEDPEEERKRKKEEIQKEIENVKREYHKNKLRKNQIETEEKKQEEEKSEILQEYHNDYKKYKEQKKELPKKGAGREQFTLKLLEKFKQKLSSVKEKQSENEDVETAESTVTAEINENDNDDDDDENWLAHKLHFKEPTPTLAKDANMKGDDWFEIYDPRNPLNKRRRGEDKKKSKTQYEFVIFFLKKMENRSSIEECPLKHQQSYCKRKPRSFKGPLRLVRLCLLSILLPIILVALPLYLRYHVYGDQLYPFAMSDMRLLDNKVSTVWCQRQLVKVNTTFNAFLLPNEPKLADKVKNVSMERHLELDDDMKEYWGFYLLKGSSITISVCSRWPGASLIVIRGHKNLHECAYIGDDSSEEIEELMENIREGVPFASSQESASKAISNNPKMMKKHRGGVKFHHPHHLTDQQLHAVDEIATDISDTANPKVLKEILQILALKTETQTKRRQSMKLKNNEPEEVKHADRYKNNEKNTMKIQHMLSQDPSQTYALTSSETALLDKIKSKIFQSKTHKNPTSTDSTLDRTVTVKSEVEITSPEVESTTLESLTTFEEGKTSSEGVYATVEQMKSESDEIIDELYRRLGSLGTKKYHALEKLNQRVIKKKLEDENSKSTVHKRRKKDLDSLMSELTLHDEQRDLGIEEEVDVDGIIKGRINETTPNDMSNSEIWSSFSSSEEALLNCSGLILNLPLTPHTQCSKNSKDIYDAYLTNTITYVVPTNGYYFFVFNSENEIQTNYIRVQFNFTKTVYNVSQSVMMCENKTNSCALDLKFFSNERLVMELPVMNNESLWNEEFIVISECQPRTILYTICVLTVPILIIVFAFQ